MTRLVAGTALTGCLTALVLTVSAPSQPDEPAAPPDPMAAVADYVYCTTCHGSEGRGNQAVNGPWIAGLSPWYVTRQLNAFKAGWRGDHPDDHVGQAMYATAGMLDTPEEVAAAVAYAATLDAPPAPATLETGDAEAGEALYTAANCGECHGAQGEGLKALGGPRLAGQNDWYLLRQLRLYRDGLRGYHADDAMGQQMAAAMEDVQGDDALTDLVAYINTLSAAVPD